MKNREKYNDIVVKCASMNDVSFGVNKHTGEPEICALSNGYGKVIACENCAFYRSGRVCYAYRKEWLESEAESVEDIWSGFRDLKRGDLIMINKGLLWSPYLFVEFEDDSIVYTRRFQLLLRESDPRCVKKPDHFIKYMEENYNG